MLPRFAIWSVNVLSVGLDYLTLNFSHNTCKMIHGLESTIIFCTYHASMLMWYMQNFMIINHGKFHYYLMIIKIYQAGLSKIFQEAFCWKVAQLLYETNSYCSQILSAMDLKAHSIWSVYEIIHSFTWTPHDMHFAWSCNERRMNWIWIITWCLRVHFICITYVIRSYETHINFISIYMNFIWTCRELWPLRANFRKSRIAQINFYASSVNSGNLVSMCSRKILSMLQENIVLSITMLKPFRGPFY